MSSRQIPLSLDELISGKSNGSSRSEIRPTLGKAKFLSKSQRQKLKDQNSETDPQSTNSNPNNGLSKKSTAVVDDVSKDTNGRTSGNTPFKLPSGPTGFIKNASTTNNHSNNSDNDTKKKRKFNFGWDEEDDTLADYSPLVAMKRSRPENDLEERRTRNRTDSDLHWTQKALSKMSDRDWRILREDFDISSKGGSVANPLRYWEEAKLSPLILDRVKTLGYSEPTPIQRVAIPTALSGRDLVGIAETGSGKTLAFLIPALEYILSLPSLADGDGPYVLILVPTRELALQIEKEFQKFKQSLSFNVASFIGGHSYEENLSKVQYGVEIVIATPGRLIDCLEKKIITLNKCFYLVMDEADRMIDMGFEIQVNKVIESLPSGDENPYYFGQGPAKRITMMFTATMPRAIEKLTSSHLVKPGVVMVGEVGGAVETVVQDAMKVPDDEDKRLKTLTKILESRRFRPPIIIFANFRKTCDTVSDALTQRGFRAVTMSGSKTQEQREAAIQAMKSGNADILVATDVAGRGIDIPDVSLVVNYQMSKTIEEYTHRIGRTGRAGKKGTAITFWNAKEDKDVLYDLRQMISKSPVSKCPEDLRRNEDSQRRAVRNIEI